MMGNRENGGATRPWVCVVAAFQPWLGAVAGCLDWPSNPGGSRLFARPRGHQAYGLAQMPMASHRWRWQTCVFEPRK